MTSAAKPSPSAPRAIYDGRDCLGHVEQRDGQVTAYDRHGRVIGTYPTAAVAIDAIVALITRGTP